MSTSPNKQPSKKQGQQRRRTDTVPTPSQSSSHSTSDGKEGKRKKVKICDKVAVPAPSQSLSHSISDKEVSIRVKVEQWREQSEKAHNAVRVEDFVTILISMFNQKGGVGKTTATYELGFNLSQMGFRILMVDADPQGSLTTTINPKTSQSLEEAVRFLNDLEEKFREGNGDLSRIDHIFYPSLQPEPDVTPFDEDDYIRQVKILPVHKYSNLYYIPGALEFSVLSDVVSMGTQRVRGTEKYALMIPNVIRSIAKMNRIDIVLIDLNPSVDAINRSIIMRSDYLWIPFKPSLGCLDSAKNLLRIITMWFAEFRERRLIMDGEGPLLLNSFPQVLRARRFNKQTTQQPHINILVLETAYASWIRPILERTSELKDVFRRHMPLQPDIPFTTMFESIMGVPDMGGTGLNIQVSGRPASDLNFIHTKATAILNDRNQEKRIPFSKPNNKIKKKVNIAYKRIIGFALNYLTEDHKRILNQRVPYSQLLLPFYEHLRADRILVNETADLVMVNREPEVPVLDDNHWYTHDDIIQLLEIKLNDTNSGFVTPLDCNDPNLEKQIVAYIQNFVLDFHPNEQTNPAFWIFIPINVNQNHWTLLALCCDPNLRQAQAFHFDPLGRLPFRGSQKIVSAALCKVFPDIGVVPLQDLGIPVQADGNNCGPWIIEAVDHLITIGHLDNMGAEDILKVRRKHAILRQNRHQSCHMPNNKAS